MNWLTSLNARLSRWALYIAVTALLSIVAVVFYGVVMRYVFHNAPPWMEQVALILVITVAMSAASVTVREDGHIGMDSLVIMLPEAGQRLVGVIVGLLTISFGVILFIGSLQMALAVTDNMIPTLGIPESTRYAPCIVAGVLIVLFAIEQLLAMLQGKEVVKSWH
jgi:TRAP-type C4-dicarboxylate transport system permease small subunit